MQWGNNNNEEQAPPVPQAPYDPMTEPITNAEFRTVFQMLEQVVVIQANQGGLVQGVGIPATLVWDFMRMNPPRFYGSKVDEDLQEFMDKVYKILAIMGVSPSKKADLASYQLKGAARV